MTIGRLMVFFGRGRRCRLGLVALVGLLASCQSAEAPDDPTNVVEESPLEIIRRVADRIISVTPFAYELIVPPAKTSFGYVKHLDFGRTFGADRTAVAYATTILRSTVDTTMTFEVSHNDGLEIWSNGQTVYRSIGTRPVGVVYRERTLDLTDTFTVELKKGENTFLLKSHNSGAHDRWQVFLKPTGGLSWQSPVTHLEVDVTALPNVAKEIGELANFLVLGPLPAPTGLATVYPVEEAPFTSAALYRVAGKKYAWTLPKIELHGDVIGADPIWGTYYNFNYHTAGVAWGFAALAERTGEKRYDDFARNYCDFMLDNYDFVEHVVLDLTGLESANHHQINKPLLDFTAAPALPFIYRLRKDLPFNDPTAVANYVDRTQDYLRHEQVRSPDGTFTRLTPRKYTTWTDDMYMGIPFLLQSALLAEDAAERQAWLDDAAGNVLGFYRRTFDAESGLFRHGSFSEEPEVPIQHWTRAQGWATFAMSEVLLHLPADHPAYAEIKQRFTEHLRTALTFQDAATGLFPNIIDRPNTKLETSGTALLVLGLSRGINRGWLPAEEFREPTVRAWEGLKGQIDPDGTVHNIIMGTGLSELESYYEGRPFVDNDSHGLIGLFFGALEMEELLATTL